VEAFRAAQRQKERAADGNGEGGEDAEEERTEWVAGRKRKRVAKGVVGILKRKATSEGDGKTSSEEAKEGAKGETNPQPVKAEEKKKVEGENKTPAAAPAAKPTMGLVSYDSDDDD